jgi:hypothetical protein
LKREGCQNDLRTSLDNGEKTESKREWEKDDGFMQGR